MIGLAAIGLGLTAIGFAGAAGPPPADLVAVVSIGGGLLAIVSGAAFASIGQRVAAGRRR